MASEQPPEVEALFDVGATGDTLQRMIELFKRHGDIYRFYVPARKCRTYVIHHPDDVKRVLVTNHRNYTKGFERDRIKILLGVGLMTSEGELWTRQRHMMQPLFHKRVVESFVRVIAEENASLIERWESVAESGDPLDLTEAMSTLALRIVLRCLFGHDASRLAPRFAVLTQDPSRNLEFVYKLRALAGSVAELVGRRRDDGTIHSDYVSMLMSARDKQSGEGMIERQLIDEIMTLVVAGHETTASVLNWAWFLLALHPQVAERLYAEIVGGGGEPLPDLVHLESMTYVTNVLNETMRLYPPGWLLSRRTIEPDVLAGYEIPAGADVLLPLYLVHRHPEFWEEPEAFRPERFSAADASERRRLTFLPFAAGPRHCIGETLARYEMLLHLYKLVPRFRLSLVGDTPPIVEAHINLRTRHPLRAVVRGR